jgi:hypothetical protein
MARPRLVIPRPAPAQRHIPKRSAGWFADIAGNNSIPAD